MLQLHVMHQENVFGLCIKLITVCMFIIGNWKNINCYIYDEFEEQLE